MTKVDIQRTAIVAHETNRIWCLANGDMSQPLWDDAPDWQKESAIKGIEFHMANPNAGDSASHDSWMAQKIADGWVYGEIKNAEATPPTHPCIVPFDQLPKVDQVKDALFRSIVHAIMAPEDEAVSGLPVSGYQPQSQNNVALVNANKHAEEALLRVLDDLALLPDVDKRWLQTGRTDIEKGFMSVNRSIFKPDRVEI